MPAIFVEDVPAHPVITAVARLAFRAKERRELEVEAMQCPCVAYRDDLAQTLQAIWFDGGGQLARETRNDDFDALCTREKLYSPGQFPAGRAGEERAFPKSV